MAKNADLDVEIDGLEAELPELDGDQVMMLDEEQSLAGAVNEMLEMDPEMMAEPVATEAGDMPPERVPKTTAATSAMERS
jgi:hypothetical protein